MKPETLNIELAKIAAQLSQAAVENPDAHAPTNLMREAAGPKIAHQGFLALELLQCQLDGRLRRDRLLFDICEAALDRWLGKAKQTVDVGVDQEFVRLLQEYREARLPPLHIILNIKRREGSLGVLLQQPDKLLVYSYVYRLLSFAQPAV